MDKAFLKQYRLINKIQEHIRASKTLGEAVEGSMRIICRACDVSMAVVWYADESDASKMRPYYWVGSHDLSSLSAAADESSIVGRVFKTEEAIRYLDYKTQANRDLDDALARMFDFETMVCVPVATTFECVGCIQFANRHDGSLFSEEDADTFELATMIAAIAIEESDEINGVRRLGNTIMELRDVTREFQNGENITQVLKGINLNIYEGEFLALLGESGCGKTTLLNIIGGLDNASDGKVTYLDHDLTHASQSELTEFRRENVGFIFQSYNLMPNLNALQNVRLIAELVDEPMNSEEALSLVGLDDRMKNYPSQLSGGQQQRVSIARALVKKPRLILADEPTAALDYATSIEVLQVMEEVIGGGTTLVMVTHNEEITRMADRVVRLRNGKMYETTINRQRAKAEDLIW